MNDFQILVDKLRDIYKLYAVNINNGLLVIVHPIDKKNIEHLLNELIEKVKPFSENIYNSLSDIRTNLFIIGPATQLNPFRFGALGTILSYLKSDDFVSNYAKYIKTDWKDINLAIQKLLKDSSMANDRLSYNQVGVLGREIYIMLAQKVFIKEIHISSDGMEISYTDTKRMLESYFDYELQRKEIKDYAKAAVKLAEKVTHDKTDDKQSMHTLIVAVISLVGIVNNVHKNKKNR